MTQEHVHTPSTDGGPSPSMRPPPTATARNGRSSELLYNFLPSSTKRGMQEEEIRNNERNNYQQEQGLWKKNTYTVESKNTYTVEC